MDPRTFNLAAALQERTAIHSVRKELAHAIRSLDLSADLKCDLLVEVLNADIRTSELTIALARASNPFRQTVEVAPIGRAQ